MPSHHTPHRSIAERFWPKVLKDGPLIRPEIGPCWDWLGGKHRQGYGSFVIVTNPFTTALAHRVSWQLHFGEIPEGMNVLHRCDNPPCTRPDHLFLGTHADNMVDEVQKGRNPNAKLTPEQVRGIRELLKAPDRHVVTIAKRYGVSVQSVYHIEWDKRWRHIT